MQKQKTKKNNDYLSLDRHLRTNKGLITSWIVIFAVLIITSIGFGVCLHFLNPNNVSFQDKYILENQKNLVDAAKGLIYTGFVLVFLPIAFLVGCWITGINGIHQSASFHGFVWILYVIMVFILIIVICLTINIYITINQDV